MTPRGGSVTPPANLLVSLAGGVSRIASRFLLSRQDRQAVGFRGLGARLGFFGFACGLRGQLGFTGRLRGQFGLARFLGGFALRGSNQAGFVNGRPFLALFLDGGILRGRAELFQHRLLGGVGSGLSIFQLRVFEAQLNLRCEPAGSAP